VVGYQFPKLTDRDDANWLVIEGRAHDGERSWSFRDPCLQTWDVQFLASWLEGLADRNEVEGEIDFTEPNLAFGRVEGSSKRTTIRVLFELEARPPWRPAQYTDDDWRSVSIDISLSPRMLRAAAMDLRSMLRRFPERA
jgi:hypothetical protein